MFPSIKSHQVHRGSEIKKCFVFGSLLGWRLQGKFKLFPNHSRSSLNFLLTLHSRWLSHLPTWCSLKDWAWTRHLHLCVAESLTSLPTFTSSSSWTPSSASWRTTRTVELHPQHRQAALLRDTIQAATLRHQPLRQTPRSATIALDTCRVTWNIPAPATKSSANACSKITCSGLAPAFRPTQASSLTAGRRQRTHRNEMCAISRRGRRFCTKKSPGLNHFLMNVFVNFVVAINSWWILESLSICILQLNY